MIPTSAPSSRGLGAEVEIVVVVIVVVVVIGDGDAGFERDGRRPASLASSRSALARRGRDRTASTSCLSSGSADMGYLRWLASSRVWSRRRSSDRRISLI